MEKQGRSAIRQGPKYVYALVGGGKGRNYAAMGINGGNVYTIPNKDVAAVVSDISNVKLRPERRHFAAHQGVLRKLMEEGDLLPMSFGIVSQSQKSLHSLLERNHKAILSQLNRVSGKVEMGLRVAWDVPNIFEYLVISHSELRTARDRLFRGDRRPAQDEMIEIGRMVDNLINSDRDQHTERVEKILARSCCEIKRSKCRDEREVMNLACLVRRDLLKDFEEAVFKAAGLFDHSFAFDYNGPWAPHNFVELNVEL